MGVPFRVRPFLQITDNKFMRRYSHPIEHMNYLINP